MSYEKNVYFQLLKEEKNIIGKRCLDIGTRNGLNCINLINLGADKVIGIDINNSRFNEMTPNNNIELIKVNLLDYNNNNKFDIITCFLWCINFKDYDKIILKIKNLLNPNGIIYIGVADNCYKYDEDVSVKKLLEKNFSNTYILDINDKFQWIMKAVYLP